ncbi:superfamily II helicase [Bradyrhizobium sp. LA6.1]
MRPTNMRATLLRGARQLITDEGFAITVLAAVIAAAVLAVGFDATADIVIATLALGAVTALAETRLHRRG